MKKIFYVSTAILLMSKAHSLDFCVKDSESFATTSKKLKEHLEEIVKSGEKSSVSLQVDKDILLKSKSATGGEVFIKTAAATYVKAPCLMMVMVDTYQDLDRETILRQESN